MIRNFLSWLKRFLFGGEKPHPTYPEDEFKEYDLLVEIGTSFRVVVLGSQPDSYIVADADRWENSTWAVQILPFSMPKSVVNRDFVEIGRWDPSSDKYVEGEEEIEDD